MGSPSAVYKEVLTESICKFNRLTENTKYENKKYIIDKTKIYTEEQLEEIAHNLYEINKPLMTFLAGYATGEFFSMCSNDELNAGAYIFSDIYNLFEIEDGDNEL